MEPVVISLDMKKEIAEHLKEAMSREELNTRLAARFLNLNPSYISMAQNMNSWDSMSKAAWERLYEWHCQDNCHQKIRSFIIPEGEAIYEKPRSKKRKSKEQKMMLQSYEIRMDTIQKSIDLLHTLGMYEEGEKGQLVLKEDAFEALHKLGTPDIVLSDLFSIAKTLENRIGNGIEISIVISNHPACIAAEK